jgi:transcriptional regulator with XRE-family HTH domain
MSATNGRVESARAIDRHVGLRIRARRRQLNISQQALGERIGVTFQQIQKYELAANRVSASALYAIAEALQVRVSWFFGGLPPTVPEDGKRLGRPERDLIAELHATAGGIDLAKAYLNVKRPSLRRRLAELVREIAELTAR